MNDLAGARTTVVFDPGAASSLAGHPKDREIGVVVVTGFCQALPERVRRIVDLLRDRDLDRAMEAVVGLKVASGALGAGELTGLGRRLEGRLRCGDVAGALALTEELLAAAHRARVAMSAYLDS